MVSKYVDDAPREEKMRLPVTSYQDEDGWYVVECPIIPGCMSQGKTQAEALQNIQEAIQLCLEVQFDLHAFCTPTSGLGTGAVA